MNVSFSKFKKHRLLLAALLAIASTACNPVSPSHSLPANPPPSATPNPSESPQQQAAQVIRNYYRAIARRDYEQAYAAWEDNGAASQQSFEQFSQGFANTTSVVVEVGEPGPLEGAAGSLYIEIPVTVTAVTRNGTPQRFRGSYVLRRVNDVPGSTPEQRQWHLHSADIQQAN